MNTSETGVATPAVAGDALPAVPYPGPREFRPGEEMLFKGRRRECADLVDLVLAYRAVVLYAQSGAGKSSLVNAAVAPALRAFGIDVLPSARVSGDLPPGVSPEQVANLFLFNLRARWLPPGTRISDADAARLSQEDCAPCLPPGASGAEAAAPRGQTLLVVDQFEELFRSSPERWREREGFCKWLAACLRADTALRLLIVIREDYLAELDPYADFFPDTLRIRYRLERLRDEQALAAIIEPAKELGVEFDAAAAEGVVRDLRRVQVRTRVGSAVETRSIEGEFVEPVQLQVVCEDIWLRKGDSRRISSATVRSGDVETALAEFYERAVSAAVARGGASEHEIRKWVSEKLITPAGTRGTVYQGDRDTAGLSNAVVSVLEKERIVRAEPRAGAVWYELTHDRFIGPIRAANRAWRERRRRRLTHALVAIVALAGVAWLVSLLFVTSRDRAVAEDMTLDGNTMRNLASQVANQGDPASLRRAADGYATAIEAYRRAGQPTARARALLDRSSVLRRLGRQDEALRDYREAAGLYVPEPANPASVVADARAFWSAGRDFYQAGNVPEAISALTRAAALAAMSPPRGARSRLMINLDLSLALARQNDYEGASAAFDRVLKAAAAEPEFRSELRDRLESIITRALLTTQAYDNLARLLASDGQPERAVQVIDGGIQVARANADPILNTLRTTRRDLLDAAVPNVEKSPWLRDYICRHNSYVVVASVSRGTAEAQLRRFRAAFPLARLRPPVGDAVAIVGDWYLTCDEAATMLSVVQSKYRTGPFLGRASTGCPDCPGLPMMYGK